MSITVPYVKVCEDLNFTIVAKPDTHHVDYAIYQIAGIDVTVVNGKLQNGEVSYESKDNNNEHTYSTEAARVFLHGSVKWDGCSNWHFDEQDECMIHGCSRSDLSRIGKVMALCWDLTEQLCPNWIDRVNR